MPALYRTRIRARRRDKGPVDGTPLVGTSAPSRPCLNSGPPLRPRLPDTARTTGLSRGFCCARAPLPCDRTAYEARADKPPASAAPGWRSGVDRSGLAGVQRPAVGRRSVRLWGGRRGPSTEKGRSVNQAFIPSMLYAPRFER